MIRGTRKTAVEGFESYYEITESGHVYILVSEHKETGHMATLSTRVDRAGYRTVRLSKEGRTHTKYLHRLLAFGFLPNPNDKRFVNHKNGNKLDNSLPNLEIVSHGENVKHAYDSGLVKPKSKKVIDSSSGEIFESSKAASIHLNIKPNTLRNYLNGNIKHNPTSLKYLL